MIERVTPRCAALGTLMLATIAVVSWADAPPAPADAIANVAMCTTDSDCAERFGGDGGPYPILPEYEYEYDDEYNDEYRANEYVTWQDV